MASASSIQSKLNVKIFSKFGSNVSVSTVASSTLNSYGDATPTYATAVTEVAVPYNQVTGRSWESFGDLNVDELDIIFKHTADVNLDDKITFGGIDYKVIRKEQYPYDGDNLAILVRIAKILG